MNAYQQMKFLNIKVLVYFRTLSTSIVLECVLQLLRINTDSSKKELTKHFISFNQMHISEFYRATEKHCIVIKIVIQRWFATVV